ncbi:MAG: hypothetical protein P8Y62_03630, partial [candidate division WOR-3 bacterium]
MDKKGLCVTCSHDKDCDFPRKFPVLQCEELNGDNHDSTQKTEIKSRNQEYSNQSTFNKTGKKVASADNENEK